MSEVEQMTEKWIRSCVARYNICPYVSTGSLEIVVCKHSDGEAERRRLDHRREGKSCSEFAPDLLARVTNTVKMAAKDVRARMGNNDVPHAMVVIPGLRGFQENPSCFKRFVNTELLSKIEAWRVGHALEVELRQQLEDNRSSLNHTERQIHDILQESTALRAISMISFHPRLNETHYDGSPQFQHCLEKGLPFMSHIANRSPWPTIHLIPTYELSLKRLKTHNGMTIKNRNNEKLSKSSASLAVKIREKVAEISSSVNVAQFDT
eukprot:jgi/Bigna1/69018/fgenesh1_pg.7_\